MDRRSLLASGLPPWRQRRCRSRPAPIPTATSASSCRSPPGGATDVVGRLWAERMKPLLGTVVTENRGGGGGVTGAAEVARAAPDGHTFLFGNTSTQVLIPAIIPNPPYDPLKDFVGVYIVCNSPTSHRRARVGAGSHAAGAHRLCQGQSGQAVLRLGRRRHADQPGGRTVQATDRRARHRAHSLQGSGARRGRSGERPYPDDDAQSRRCAARLPPQPARSASWR